MTTEQTKYDRRIEKRRRKRLNSGNSYASRNVILERMGFSSYAAYLASDLWKRIRARVFRRKGRTCYLCGGAATAVHHNRYSYKDLAGKTLSQLFPICDPCHDLIEFSKKGKKLDVSGAKSRFIEAARKRTRYLTDLILNHEPER